MAVYLDNCSTTKPREEVINVITESLREDFGNPSSLHRLGIKSEKKIEQARELISSYLGVNKGEIYFTSGGTESNNIAIQSIINKYTRRGNHIITSRIEHSSVLNTMKYYESKGFDITYLNVDKYGYISLEELKNSVREDTILVSVMHVNNEVGAIEPIGKIKNILKQLGSKALLHVDGIQSFGKIKVCLKDHDIDTYSFSGHKVYGPKGIGGLYINDKLNLSPIVYGGNQEKGIRSGTENLTGIIGFGEAVKIMEDNFEREANHVFQLKTYFANRIQEEIEHIKINTILNQESSPYILNISFKYIRGEVLLHYLEDKGIYVSTSSACSSKGTEKSHVLKSMGLTNEEIEGAIRICFSYDNTKEEIDYTIQILKDSIAEIRQIIMR